MGDQNNILRPTPRRPFELTPISTDSSTPPTPSPESLNPELLDSKLNGEAPPSRSRSLLNLTSSTLFGIYSPTGYDAARDEPSTPWGTGAQTPGLRTSSEGITPESLAAIEARTNTKALHHPHVSPVQVMISLLVRSAILFAFGMAYGTVITHLHESEAMVPVKVRGINRQSWLYGVFWGTCGVALGNLLPWIDSKAKGLEAQKFNGDAKQVPRGGVPDEDRSSTGPIDSLGADWNPAVRGIGAFIGIAFAIRRLQWQSTMQVSLTLALVNPCLWYMIDRTKTGFALSSVVGILGTEVLLLINPDTVPPPTTSSSRSALAQGLSQGLGKDGLVTDERIAVATWIASVLFCSSVCFGNIGRRLAQGRQTENV